MNDKANRIVQDMIAWVDYQMKRVEHGPESLRRPSGPGVRVNLRYIAFEYLDKHQ